MAHGQGRRERLHEVPERGLQGVVWWRFWGFFCFFLCVFGRLASSPCGLCEFSVMYVGGVWEFGTVFFVHGVNMGMMFMV